MDLKAINNYSVQPEFTSNKGKEKAKGNVSPTSQVNNNEGYSGAQVGGAVLATAMAAAVLGGAVMRGRGQSKINALLHDNSVLKSSERELQAAEKALKENVSKLEKTVEEKTKNIDSLNEANKKIKEANANLQKELQDAKDKFQDIFEGDIAPKDVREKIYNGLKSKVDNGKLDYDASTPPVTGKKSGAEMTSGKAIPLPKSGTVNRAGMQSLNIPEIAADGHFDFRLPNGEMKVSHMESVNFTPLKNQMTNITESYADSVQWNNDKIARDVLQNFFDGHGQTLDGVHLSFTPTGNGKFKIRIEGDSTYTPDKAVYIGESTKRNNSKAAGNYGEGLKMSVLKLLKDAGASDVKIGSDNWNLTYTLAKGNLSDKRVLSYSLDKVPNKLNGNYMEFETSDRALLDTFRTSINRFYHSGNPHFKAPDFENDLIGVKKLATGEKGGIYIAGQRFEFNNDYDGLDNIALFIKEKPPVKTLDPSRDRTSLGTDQLKDIASWIAHDHRMSVEDKGKLLDALKSYWNKVGYGEATPTHEFLDRFLLTGNYTTGMKEITFKFPEKCVAYSSASDDIVRDLKMNGYTVCNERFADWGMQTIRDVVGDARAHEVILPDANQTKKILVLKEALQKLAPSLEGTHFKPEELNSKIFMFDKNGLNESGLNSGTLAEAIVDNGTSKGFWIDKNYLDNANFSDVLETALHELSHKAGGDESAEFSYKLTDVNASAIKQMLNDPKTRTELQALNRLWSEITTAQ